MFRKVGLPLMALAGIFFALFMIYYGSRKPPVAPVLFQPATSPYKHYVAGQGIIETVGKNIPIGVPFPELVAEIYVKVGDQVKKGTALFKLDTRKLEAQLAQALQAENVARAEYANATEQFNFYKRLTVPSAVSEQAYTTAQYAQETAAQTLAAAQAATQVIATDIERSIIRAPSDGQILQNNISVGEVVNINPFNQEALMLFGDTTMYHLRVDIDEEDAWRVVRGAPATAFIRGNSRVFIPLEYAYLEPYIIPKVALSGSAVERVDTRVLQVVYRFSKNNYPVYVGQLLDVFLEAQSGEVAA